MDEERKRLVLWLWVGVVATAIFIGWLFTFRATARQILAQPAPGNQPPALENFQQQFQASLKQMRETWAAAQNQPTTDNAPPTTPPTPEQINKLKEGLQKL